jgi:type I restriction enzyme M protein
MATDKMNKKQRKELKRRPWRKQMICGANSYNNPTMAEKVQGTFIERALADGYAEITGEGKTERIHYKAAQHSERWSDPEEKVRAEFWAELIYKYDYYPTFIAFEISVPRRTPNDYADLVIYNDVDKKSPYFVFECKRADISDAEFAQSIEQACGNRASLCRLRPRRQGPRVG